MSHVHKVDNLERDIGWHDAIGVVPSITMVTLKTASGIWGWYSATIVAYDIPMSAGCWRLHGAGKG